jgi:hypothetical protein
MLKPLIAATAALAIAGSSIVYAQQRFGGHDGPRAEHRHRMSPEDRAAFVDARIAALKAGLELSPDQAKNWPGFEQALRDLAQLRMQRWQARHQQGDTQQPGQAPTTPFDRLARRADEMAKTSAALKRVADAGAPLFQSLTDAQKGRFRLLARMLRPHQHMQAGNERGEGWRRGGRGEGRYGENDGRLYGRGDREQGGYGSGHHHRRFGQDDRGPNGGTSGMNDDGNQDANQDSQL